MAVTLPEALALLRAAIETDYPGFAPSSVVIESAEGYSAIQLPLMPAPLPRRESSGSRPNSPTEELILKALAGAASGAGWLTGQQLADACGLPKSTLFSAVLTNLAEAGVVESSTRHGYRLVPSPVAPG